MMAIIGIGRVPPHMLQPIPAETVPELLASRDGFANLLLNLRNMKQTIEDIESSLSTGYISSTGGTMTGPLILGGGASIPSGQNLYIDGSLVFDGSLDLEKNISKVSGIQTCGPFGVSAVLATASEVELTNINTNQIINFMPSFNGNFLIYLYLRINSSPTAIYININYKDAGGVQDQQILNSNAIQNIGSYCFPPIFVNAVANNALNITAQVRIANQVFISASIIGL